MTRHFWLRHGLLGIASCGLVIAWMLNEPWCSSYLLTTFPVLYNGPYLELVFVVGGVSLMLLPVQGIIYAAAWCERYADTAGRQQ